MTCKPLHATSRMGIVRSFQQTNTFRTATVRENISRAVRFGGGGQGTCDAITPLVDEFELAPQLESRATGCLTGCRRCSVSFSLAPSVQSVAAR